MINYTRLKDGTYIEQGLDIDQNKERLRLLEWLQNNDRNGIYRDEDSIKELGNICSLEYAREIYNDQTGN